MEKNPDLHFGYVEGSRDCKPKTQFEVIRGDPEPDVSTVAAHATLPLRLLSLANCPPPPPDLLCDKNHLSFAIYGVRWALQTSSEHTSTEDLDMLA